jgi:oxygen-independent coproporphyrinogen-3 oxidase
MGLRLKKGINLKKKNNLLAYEYFKNKLKYVHVKNNHLIANNRNKLNDILIELL